MKRFTRILIALFLVLGLMQIMPALASPVSPLWEQLPGGDRGAASFVGNWIPADDFVLTNKVYIEQVEFWSSILGPVQITVKFYANTLEGGYNRPVGDPLYTATLSSTGIAEDTSICASSNTYCAYRHTLTLSSPMLLDVGRYWVSIYGSSELYWSYETLANAGWNLSGYWWNSTWYYLQRNFAFRIFGFSDLVAPEVIVPSDITEPATGSGGAEVTFSASATDNVDGSITPVCVPASGSTFPIGDTTVTCSATDAAGNIGSAKFTVTVSDQTNPVVTVPANMTVPATSPSGAVVTFQASATDNVDGAITPVCVPVSGSTFPLGQTTVTCTAMDAALNEGSASFTVTVRGPLTLVVNAINDVVDGSCDATHCSLREAVNAAINGDTITFELTYPAVITLGGQIRIEKSLTILGPGSNKLTISGGEVTHYGSKNSGGVFYLHGPFGGSGVEPISVSMSGLTIKDGRARYGGGIANDSGSTLTLTDCVIGPNNIVLDAGGGISNMFGSMTLNRCSVVGNHGTGATGGAGIFAQNGGSVTLINSTVTENITNNLGGGILSWYGGTVNLIHTTVSGNIANEDWQTDANGGGGGVFIREATVTIQNSIIAGNTDKTAQTNPLHHTPYPDVYGAFTSLTGNLIGDGTGATGLLSGLGDMVGSASEPLDPKLGSFGVYSPGITPLFPLLPESIAIDAVFCPSSVTIDQRGVTRPQGDACDIGAFELEQEPSDYLIFLPLIQR